MDSEPSLTALMQAADDGNRTAADALFAALYSQLQRLARYELARKGGPVSLSTITLLHQAYIEIAGKDGASFADRGRFMSYASRVMRGLIIDHARNRSAQKRGGLFEITSLGTEIENAVDDRYLVRVSDALDELAKTEPSLAEVVDLKYFCGFSFAEIAGAKNVSERTVQRQWQKARIYLHRRIRADLET